MGEGAPEATSQHYQRALDLEALGMMGIAPKEKYRREVDVVFSDPRFSSLPSGSSVLDVACGRGDTSVLLDERGFKVTAVDASAAAIDEAQRVFDFQADHTYFQVGDMKNPPKSEDGYDAVTCFGRSFAYFKTYEEYVEALKNWRDALKSGGKVAIEWTEWMPGVEWNPWQSLYGAVEVDSDGKPRITVPGSQEAVEYGDERKEDFKYPGPKFPGDSIKVRYGGRRYIDPSGEKHDFGKDGSFFVDLLKQENFPLIERMMKEAGFVNVRLIEAPQPLTPPGQPKCVKVFAVTAEKPSETSLAGVVARMRARYADLRARF